MTYKLISLICGLSMAVLLSGWDSANAKPLFSSSQNLNSTNPDISEADIEFEAVMDKSWQLELEFNPEKATYLGMGNSDLHSQWYDGSPQGWQRQLATQNEILAQLNKIDYANLSSQNRINYDLLTWQHEMMKRYIESEAYLMPMSQRGGVQTLDDFANYMQLDTVENYQHWLSRLQRIPALLEQTTETMKLGMRKGMVPPKATMNRIPSQLESLLADEPTESRFYAKFETLPEHFSDDETKLIQQHARHIIRDNVLPAYRQFHKFFVEEYLPASRDTVGLSHLPNGDDLYQLHISYFTTTDMTPEDIHQLGLQEVAKNRKEMDKIIKEVAFEGTFGEFIKFLRSDPQFFYDSPEALFNAYLATSKRLDPEMTKLFSKLPRMPYGVKAIPDNIAPDTTTAYYSRPSADGRRAGYYYVNLHEPHTRPKYEIEVLSVHEAVPGHHLQLALQMELGELPYFRRYNGFTVFIEGWGLYSERLGYDMGLYQDPYSRFGQLTYDMWRSIRLVVDTGMHAMGWTRQEAIDYFLANAAKSEEDIINEIDRYISNPGQALAYKIGQLKILELRERATQTLGEEFDIRKFHDVVLGSGSIPLHVLEKNVQQWIDSHN
ncbi:DUF885 domain-containing protein [Alteromonas sp. ASW11-19]|uniref:DUF885 domain-containing protein n=1 Tax=Alteromonas salexigens TaxID=2982530 RepID=A0ABT2VQR9_9ALTE|nr:DUF885 domain-containing protein [Alteromonas salexigens]MCU7555227.1 DUF885 domain-containing protein [Alteromonas salexigens]